MSSPSISNSAQLNGKPLKVKRAIQNRKGFPWLLLAPTLVVLALLGLFPFIYAIRIAVMNISISKPYIPQLFVGLMQYKELVRDPNFLNALKVTIIYTFEAVFIQFWAGLGIALLFRRRIILKGAFRVCILVPMVITPVVVGLMWRFLLYPHAGIVTYYAQQLANLLGVASPQFLANPKLALQTLIWIDIWEWTPFMFLILHAGLSSLPAEPFEAAMMDGASKWHVFRTVTMPLLKQSIMIALLIRTMDAFRTFDTIFVLTEGGPGNGTETLNIFLTHLGFKYFHTSKAAAMSLIMLVMIIAMSLAFIRVLRKDTGEVS
jgi:multiple sugar transport system permease protein